MARGAAALSDRCEPVRGSHSQRHRHALWALHPWRALHPTALEAPGAAPDTARIAECVAERQPCGGGRGTSARGWALLFAPEAEEPERRERRGGREVKK